MSPSLQTLPENKQTHKQLYLFSLLVIYFFQIRLHFDYFSWLGSTNNFFMLMLDSWWISSRSFSPGLKFLISIHQLQGKKLCLYVTNSPSFVSSLSLTILTYITYIMLTDINTLQQLLYCREQYMILFLKLKTVYTIHMHNSFP